MEKNDPQLVELVILPMKSFGEGDVERLSNILSSGKNTNLKSISASGHALTSMSLTKLGQALASKKSNVCHIAVGDENMKDEGVESFCRPIVEINGGSIESVDFSYKSITSVGAGIIGRTFGNSKYLKRLDLYRNPEIGGDGIIKFSMRTSSCSKEINTSNSFVGLEHLDISECAVGSEGVKALVDCLTTAGTERPNQIDLQASSNDFGPEGCIHLANLISNHSRKRSALKKISMKKCCIGNEGFGSIVESFRFSCEGFCVLDVADNGIGLDGALSLAKSLSEYETNIKTLQDLNLANNYIGDDGVITLAGSLKQNGNCGNSTIDTLDLSTTKCGIDGAVAILKCTSLKSVRLFNNNLGSDGFDALRLLLLGGHATLEHLDLGGNRAKESAVAALLRAIMVKNEPDTSVLRTIELGGNEVGEEVESILRELSVVRPELDVARDRPSVEQPNDFQGGEIKM